MITALSGVIITRLIIHEYGSSVNGLVVSIKQLLIYFNVVSAGIGVSSLAALYKPIAEFDYTRINGILSATGQFFKKSGYVFLALLSATVLIYPAVVNSSLSTTHTRILIAVISGSTIIEYMFLTKYRVFLNAAQKANITFWYQTQGTALNTILSVILIELHCSILVVQWAASLVYLLRAMAIASYVRRNYRFVNYRVEPDVKAISSRWTAFSYKVSEIVITCTPVVIITLACGLLEVSVYAVYNMIFFTLGTVISVLSTGLASTFGDVAARREVSILRKSFRTYEFLFYCTAFSCYSCALKLTLPFVAVYTKGITDIDYFAPIISYVFIASGLAQILRTPARILVEATGRFKENTTLNIAEAGITVALSVAFVFRMGIPGVLFASFITGTLRTIAYIFYANRYILKQGAQKTLLSISLNIALLAAFALVPVTSNVTSFLEWTVLAIKVTLPILVIVFLCNAAMDIESLNNLIYRIKHLLHRPLSH